jgi:CPA2 family monovalent cation:H+ antiporter-2
MAVTQQDFLVSMAVVIAVAALIVILFHRLRQPLILGYLVAGLMVGLVAQSLFTSAEDSVRLLANLGIVLITFSIGLEFSLKQLRKIGITVIVAAALEIAIMIAIGFQLGTALGWTSLESTLLGAMLSVASTMIIVRSLKESGGLDNEKARLIVGLLVVEDFAAILILAAVSGLVSTGNFSTRELTYLVLKMAGFVAASIVFGVAVVPRLVDYVGRQRSNELLVVTALGLCFSMAAFAKVLGLSEAIGAFVMGVIVSESKYLGDVVRRVEPVRDVFGAIFFVTVGMLAARQLSTLPGGRAAQIDVILTVLIITAVFVVGKLFASSLATFICGFGARNSLGAGLGMLAIGEFSLMIATVAISSNPETLLPHIAKTIYPTILLVTTITALIVPYSVKYTDRVTRKLEGRVPRSAMFLTSYLNLLARNMRRRSKSSIRISNEMRNSITRIMIYIVVMVTVVFVAVSTVPLASKYSYLVGGSEDFMQLLIIAGALVVVLYGMYGLWSRTIRLIEVSTSEAMLSTKSAENIGYLATSKTLKWAFLGLYVIVGLVAISPFIRSIFQQNIVFAIVVMSIIAVAALALWRSARAIDAKLSEIFEPRQPSPFGDSSRDLDEIEDIIAAMESGRP